MAQFNGSASSDLIIFLRDSGGTYFVFYDQGNDGGGQLISYGTSLSKNEMIVDGSGGNDIIASDASISDSLNIRVTLIGNTGNDDLQGIGSNDDFLDASAGNDTLRLGEGDDTLAGGNNTDTAVAAYASGSESVNWSLDGVANDSYFGTGGVWSAQSVGAENLVGGSGNDTLVGSGGPNTIQGAGGNDSISGVGDADSLIGDGGNDTLDGGSGNDTLVGGSGADALFGQAGQDRFHTGDGVVNNDTADGGSAVDAMLAEDPDVKISIP